MFEERTVALAAATTVALYSLYSVWSRRQKFELHDSPTVNGSATNQHHHKSTYGPPLPNTTAPPPPYSQETHELYKILLKMGQDTLMNSGNDHHASMCYYCRRTGNKIHGVRYVCSQCPDVEMCEQCERENYHEQSHILYKIPLYVPPQLENTTLYRNQIPWQSDENINYLNSTIVPHALSFDQIEALRNLVRFNMSAAEIEALYDQFRCLVDEPAQDPILGRGSGISYHALQEVLATRYSPDSYLSQVLCHVYDRDGDGLICFSDYVQVADIILGSDSYLKLSVLLSDTVVPQGTDLKSHIRNMLLAVMELAKNAFVDATNIQMYAQNPSKFFDRGLDTASDDTNLQSAAEREQDTLLWDNRDEINSWATYDPVTKPSPETDIDMQIMWGYAIEDLINEIFGSLPFNVDRELLVKTIMKNPSHSGPIIGCLEAGIL
uniref:ARAD1D40150p n=1 Tax=Blastobotrys adeninivorans TaxID=409370 RepID=A0A060TCP1_BLAAD